MGAGIAVLLAWAAAAAAPALAAPVSGPRETVYQTYTTTAPGAPSGFSFDATYHAAGDPKANPPYMRRMVFYNPSGVRYDTSVPARVSSSFFNGKTLK